MSAIIASKYLNDFISPNVVCIKPVETLPPQEQTNLYAPRKVHSDVPLNAHRYEVTTEDRVSAANAQTANISLTDCLACSGCVTSEETRLVSLQSHAEVLSKLDAEPSISAEQLKELAERARQRSKNAAQLSNGAPRPPLALEGRLFVASISPQVRASLAATYGTTEREAGWMIEQLLCGPQGIGLGGTYGSSFSWILDTNAMRAVALALEAESLPPFTQNSAFSTKAPRLTSACPAWICYTEKEKHYVLPHLSPLKSPQALTGTLVKSVLSATLGVDPQQIWHLTIMPCLDKKLEAARGELTDAHWYQRSPNRANEPVRDVDCVITARELLMIADAREIRFPALPREPLGTRERIPFPDCFIESYLTNPLFRRNGHASRGPSGGFLSHVLAYQKAHFPGSIITTKPGRNTDVVQYTVSTHDKIHFRAARYYGFRNIKNLTQKMNPSKSSRHLGAKRGASRLPNGKAVAEPEDDYVEVMACPKGCTNGGGQIKIDDLSSMQSVQRGITGQKELLGLVDEAYFSMEEDGPDEMIESPVETDGIIDGIPHKLIHQLVGYWANITGVTQDKLLCTTFNAVESDVGKTQGNDAQHVIEIARQAGL